ncbi:unnamed protein product [Symbiodinium sp. CCMP2592]|nr:unnamed protein product [Symbiodinium sp. CCMP2592]
MAEAMQADPQSPQPKKRGAPEEEKLSLEAIREVVRSEVGGSTAALRAEIGQRMDRVETGVTAQLEKTLEGLATINNQQLEQQRVVEAIQGEQYSVNARLQALESKVQVLQTTGGTSTTADTEETLNKVKQMVKDLRLDICTDNAFVPGVRRGYAIIPYANKEGEDSQQLRERLTGALKRVRQANVQMGAHADGKAKYLPQKQKKQERGGSTSKPSHEDYTRPTTKSRMRTEPTESSGEQGDDPAEQFHTLRPPPKGGKQKPFTVATWNVGGLTAANALEMLQTFGGNTALSSVAVVLLQEVITEAGRHFAASKAWKLVYGKMAGEWRGEGVAFLAAIGTHTGTQVLRAGVATTLLLPTGKKVGLLSAHMPHHATIPRAEAIMLEWGECTALRCPKAVVGIDANEQFTPSEHASHQEQAQGHTGRAESILAWLAHNHIRLPPQDLQAPSHFPYDTTQTPRRLDYVAIRGIFSLQGQVLQARDIARSDHEPVALQLRGDPPKQPKQPDRCGPRHVHIRSSDELQHILDQAAQIPPGDRHHQIAVLSQHITKPGRGKHARFEESKSLKQARRLAHNTPPGEARRQAWKAVSKQLHQEQRAWKQAIADRASQHDWPAYRQHKKGSSGETWIAALTDTHDWQGALLAHFKNIFHKADGDARDADFAARRGRLRWQCKHTTWQPFTAEEIEGVATRWKNSKCTVERGITVLLPKEATPLSWGETRPITLSSTILKAIAQLLLRRCAYTLKPHNTLQWAAPGRQGTELILTLRKVARMARDWGGTFWIIKLDLAKAFDSVAQTSLADLVERRMGADHPWEAVLWMSLLQARGVTIAAGGADTLVPQTNGVRQGSPDSPVLFSARVGECLLQTVAQTQNQQRQGGNPKLPPPPHHAGAFMDDTYLWGEQADHLQRTLDILQRLLREHGLRINPKKTRIICSTDDPHRFHIDGEWVAAESGEAALTVLGSPVSFRGGPPHLAAEMCTRARKAWGKNKALLTADTNLKQRLQLHNILVRQSALWAAETWPVQTTLLQAANVQQLQQVRSMVGGGRAPGEPWTEWNKRSLRMARVHLHKNKIERWSTYILRMIWGIWGHAARAQDITYEMLMWRGMEWWWQQQALPDDVGARHADRFNSSLDAERHIAAIAGTRWGEVARDRLAWEALEEKFVEAHDPPWCSGKQAQLQNLAQTKQDARRAKAIRDRRQARRAGRRLLN